MKDTAFFILPRCFPSVSCLFLMCISFLLLRYPRTTDFKTTDNCSLESKLGCRQGCAPSEGSRGGPFSCLVQLLVAPGNPCCSSGCRQVTPASALLSHGCLPCVSVSLLRRTPVMRD